MAKAPALSTVRSSVAAILNRLRRASKSPVGKHSFPGAVHEVPLSRDVFMSVGGDGRVYVWTNNPQRFYNPVRQNALLDAFRKSVEEAHSKVSNQSRAGGLDQLLSSLPGIGGAIGRRELKPGELTSLVAFDSTARPSISLYTKSLTGLPPINDPKLTAMGFPVASSEATLEGFPTSLDRLYNPEQKASFLRVFEENMKRLLRRK